MSNLTIIEHIKKTCEQEQISAYSIAKAINISISAVRKILNGETKSPSGPTIEAIRNYLISVVDLKYPNTSTNSASVNEPEPAYAALKKPQTPLEVALSDNIELLSNNMKLYIEIVKLKKILDENNIKY